MSTGGGQVGGGGGEWEQQRYGPRGRNGLQVLILARERPPRQDRSFRQAHRLGCTGVMSTPGGKGERVGANRTESTWKLLQVWVQADGYTSSDENSAPGIYHHVYRHVYQGQVLHGESDRGQASPRTTTTYGTNKAANNPTMQPPNSQRTKLKPIHLSSDTSHSNRHSQGQV